MAIKLQKIEKVRIIMTKCVRETIMFEDCV